MPAYAVALISEAREGLWIVSYLKQIDATLAPFGGRFIVHGETPEVKEGQWINTMVMIQFPDIDAARGWYDSPAYQAILPLRTGNSEGTVVLIDGTPSDHKATDILPPALLAQA